MKWANGITEIVSADLGGHTPASVNRETGVMYIDTDAIKSQGVSKDQLFFIMLHEMGHIVLRTTDELRADQWAHEQYVKHGGSLKQSVFALTDRLNFNKPEDYTRATLQLERAQQFDRQTNKAHYSGEQKNNKAMSYQSISKPYGFARRDNQFTEYFSGKKSPYLHYNDPSDVWGWSGGTTETGGSASGGSKGFNWDAVIGAAGSLLGGFLGSQKNTGGSSGGSGSSMDQYLILQEQQRQAQQRTLMIAGGIILFVVAIVVMIKLRR